MERIRRLPQQFAVANSTSHHAGVDAVDAPLGLRRRATRHTIHRMQQRGVRSHQDGAIDTVIPMKTGVLFDEQTPEAVAQAIELMEQTSFDAEAIRRHASQFSPAAFRSAMLKSVQTIMRGDRQL